MTFRAGPNHPIGLLPFSSTIFPFVTPAHGDSCSWGSPGQVWPTVTFPYQWPQPSMCFGGRPCSLEEAHKLRSMERARLVPRDHIHTHTFIFPFIFPCVFLCFVRSFIRLFILTTTIGNVQRSWVTCTKSQSCLIFDTGLWTQEILIWIPPFLLWLDITFCSLYPCLFSFLFPSLSSLSPSLSLALSQLFYIFLCFLLLLSLSHLISPFYLSSFFRSFHPHFFVSKKSL